MAINMDDNQKFEALMARYRDQVELMRALTKIDLQVFSGFITLQIVVVGWLLEHPIEECVLKSGSAIIDLTLTLVAVVLLTNNYFRRKETKRTLDNVMTALRFDEPDFYSLGQPLNPKYTFRPWLPFYLTAVIATFVVVLLALFVRP